MTIINDSKSRTNVGKPFMTCSGHGLGSMHELHPHIPEHSPASRPYSANSTTTGAGGNIDQSIAASSSLGSAGRHAIPGVMMMIYGSADACARIGGCGLHIVPREAYLSEKRMDKDGTLDISFDEWRDYLLFHPSTNLHDIILYWRHATNLDLGEDLSVPDDFSKEEWVSGEWWRHLVSGGFAGVGSRTATAPLDRLKIYLQVYGFKHNKNLLQCIKYMKKEGGIFSLWRGNGINVLKIAPESAIKFFAYEQSKKLIYNFHNRNGEEIELKTTDRLLAGSMAGVVSQSTIFPMEVLKIRLALRTTGQYKGIFDAVYKIYKNEGIKSFYRGYIPNLFGIIPYAGIDFAVYESLKNYYLKRHNDKDEPAWFVITACGALSSSCGQFAAYPFALVRTRLQAQVRSKEGKFDQPTTMLGLFKHIVKNEGLKGLYRGITPNFMKVAPSAAISYYIYEKCRQAFGVKMT